MIKVLVAQFRNEALRLRHWLTYNAHQGVDFFILCDDFSDDNSEAVIKKTLRQGQYLLLKTDGEGTLMGTTDNKPGHAAVPELSFHMRICRSYNAGLQIAKKTLGNCLVGFLDVDEFLHTPDPTQKAWDVLLSQVENDPLGYISVYSLDVSDRYEIKDESFILSDACNYRWCFDEFKGNIVHERHKSACLSSVIQEIPQLEGWGIHTCGQPKANFIVGPDRLRIHHYRKPSMAPRFSCFDDTLVRKLKCVCF